eukprot:jgi/Ulvmu1/81/UM001_0084.1
MYCFFRVLVWARAGLACAPVGHVWVAWQAGMAGTGALGLQNLSKKFYSLESTNRSAGTGAWALARSNMLQHCSAAQACIIWSIAASTGIKTVDHRDGCT